MPAKKRPRKAKRIPAKFPELPPAPMVAQPHGGALRVGNPGGGGGRPPDEWKALLARLATRAKTVGALGIILRDPNHQHFANAFKYVNSRSYPELEPVIIAAKLRASASNNPAPVGGLTINFNFQAEGPRFGEVAAALEEPNGNGDGHK